MLSFLLSQHVLHLIWRLRCEFEHHLIHTVNFRSLLVHTWNPQKPTFLTFFGQKRKIFPHKVIFMLSQHLVHLIWRLDFDVELHLSHTVKFRSLLVQTWKPMKPIFLTFFGPKRKLFLHKVPFINATSCKSNSVAIQWVWASSESYSKNPKRFSADMITSKSHFLTLLARNANFYRNKFDFVLLLLQLMISIGRLDCVFELHWSHTVKFWGFRVQTWK